MYHDKKSYVKGPPWTQEEDQLVKHLVENSIGHQWTKVGAQIGRTGKQVRERYLNTLSSDLAVTMMESKPVRVEWTLEEDLRLKNAQEELGNKWVSIKNKYFPHRAESDVKNRFSHSAFKANTTRNPKFNSRSLLGVSAPISRLTKVHPSIPSQIPAPLKQKTSVTAMAHKYENLTLSSSSSSNWSLAPNVSDNLQLDNATGPFECSPVSMGSGKMSLISSGSEKSNLALLAEASTRCSDSDPFDSGKWHDYPL